MSNFKNPVIMVVGVLVMANIIALWMSHFIQSDRVAKLEQAKTTFTKQIAKLSEPAILTTTKPTSSPSDETSPSPSPSPETEQIMPDFTELESNISKLQTDQGDQDTLLADVQQSIKDLWTKLTQVEEAATTTQTITQVVQQPAETGIGGESTIKEQIFYMGSGSSKDKNWDTIDAATITLDSNNFSIHEVKFEAGLSIIGGEVYAQLINKNSGGAISSSELSHNNQTATWKSRTINLVPGNNTYQVQIKTTSGETATLHGARIKIYTN